MELGTDKKCLVLQGGGALGAYQAGSYEALHAAGIRPEWVAGISIGSINAAIIAGSPDDKRIANLRAFWEKVSSGPSSLPFQSDMPLRKWFNEFSSALNSLSGVNGFYTPRATTPWHYLSEPAAAISFYDTSPLIETLQALVDFDLINKNKVRVSLGAVNVATGNFAYFDNSRQALSALHVAASGALPPGFPPVEIDGQFYWDGGLVSNTPLQWILDEHARADDICVFQVDLFSAIGRMPSDMSDVAAREKEIRFSSRTRMNTDVAGEKIMLRKALARLLAKLPPELGDDPDARLLRQQPDLNSVTIVHLIYRRQDYETHSMDNEFSRLTMEEHWKAGYDDVMQTLQCSGWVNRTIPDHGFVTIDHRRHRRHVQA